MLSYKPLLVSKRLQVYVPALLASDESSADEQGLPDVSLQMGDSKTSKLPSPRS